MANELRDKGIAIANQAVEADNAQRYDEAIKAGKQAHWFKSRYPPFGWPHNKGHHSYMLAIGRKRGQTKKGGRGGGG